MERADIKRVLKEMGVVDELLEMPAAIEPIYRELMEKSEKELRKPGRVTVDGAGNFSYTNRRIRLDENGEAEIDFADMVIRTNIYGIETYYSDGNTMSFFSTNIREDGTIRSISGNNSDCSYYETRHLDNGSWSIRSAHGVIIDETSSSEEPKEFEPVAFTLEEVLEEFDTNSKPIIENYPKTAEWFEQTRAKLQERAEKELEPEARTQRKIDFLERRVSQLEQDKKDLLNRNSRLIDRLEKSIKFINEVKRSPAGKLFFRKGIKTLEEESKKLPEGIER